MGNIWLIIFLVVIVIISLIATLVIFKQEENKMKEREGDTAADEMRRSEEYEQESLKSHMPKLIWTYVITIVAALVVFAIYLF